MPSVSQKQHNFMEMVAHDPVAAKRVGVSPSVGREFVDADKSVGVKRKASSLAKRGLISDMQAKKRGM